MNMLRAMIARFAGLLRRRKHEAEMSEEMRAHLDALVERNLAAGMSQEDARYAARRRFGGIEQAKAESREARRAVWAEQMLQDVRYAFRGLIRRPGFTVTVVGSLALGIGANTAIFGLLDAVLWKSLPVAEPERLVFLERFPVRSGIPGLAGRKFSDISYPLLGDLVARSGVLAGGTTLWADSMNAIVGGESEPVQRFRVAENFFAVLGVAAAAGRTFQPGDAEQDSAIISHGYWQRRFGGQPVVGAGLVLNGKPHTIVGVAAAEFFGIAPGSTFDVCTAAPERELARNPGKGSADPSAPALTLAVARLRPEVSLEQANRALTGLLRQMLVEQDIPDVGAMALAQHSIQASSASRGLDRLRTQFAKPLAALMGLVALVLLLTCANLANLLLARGAARQREFVIRLAIGAARSRLMRQLLTESVLIALLGAGVGLLLARLGLALLLKLVPSVVAAPLDLRVLGFTCAVALLAGLLFGVAPAWVAGSAGGGNLFGRAGQRSARTSRMGKALVIAQVALSLILVTMAGLFVRSFQNLAGADTGFQQERILVVSVDPRMAGRQGAQLTDLYARMLARVATLPGVAAATLERHVPLSGGSSTHALAPAGYTPPAGPDGVLWSESVGPRYFETLGFRLRAGRDFRAEDDARSPKVAALNETAARLFFPNRNPVGQRIGPARNRAEYEVVAVVADTQHATRRERMRATVYLPVFQDAGIRETALFLRTQGDPRAVVRDVRAALREIDPALPIMGVTTLDEVSRRSLAQDRLTAALGGGFGGLALVLAAVGIGGLMSFSVARRTHEIGVRMALGANHRDVAIMVAREALLLALAGIAIGLPAALLAANAARSLLFGLNPADPGALIAAVALLAGVGALAAIWPARRAARVDPLIALRAE